MFKTKTIKVFLIQSLTEHSFFEYFFIIKLPFISFRIMMLTVMKNTKNPVKFWFLKNYLSPTIKV